MINTERGIPGFSGCYMKERQGLADACECMCAFIGGACEPGRHCVRWGVKARSPGD